MKKKILSALISLAMLVSALPGISAMADETPSWQLFSESFDEASAAYRMVNARALLESNDSDGNIFGDYASATVSGGMLNVPQGGGVKPTIMLKDAIAVPTGHDIIIETRVKYNAQSNCIKENGIAIADNGSQLFNIMGAGANNFTRGIVISQPGSSSTLLSAGNGNGAQETSTLNLQNDTWYIFSIYRVTVSC